MLSKLGERSACTAVVKENTASGSKISNDDKNGSGKRCQLLKTPFTVGNTFGGKNYLKLLRQLLKTPFTVGNTFGGKNYLKLV